MKSDLVFMSSYRLWRKSDKDFLIIVHYAPGYSAYNPIERTWSPLSKALSGVVFSNLVPGEESPPFLQNITPEDETKKMKVVLDNAGANLCQIWNGLEIKDIPVEAVYKYCDHVDKIWNDFDDLKWYFDQTPMKVSREPEKKGFSKKELETVTRVKAKHDDAVRHCDRRNEFTLFLKCPPNAKRCEICMNAGAITATQPFYDLLEQN